MTKEDQTRVADQQLAYGGVDTMCQAIGISRSLYYKLPAEERPPHFMLGTKPIFPLTSTREWLTKQMAKSVGEAA